MIVNSIDIFLIILFMTSVLFGLHLCQNPIIVILWEDTVCIIESMKLMNEINTEFSGRVAEIYVKNGEAVEYGQKIMRIE